jgi:hypothetical protein
MFDRIHCSCRIHCLSDRFISEFGRFIDKISRYSSIGDFIVHIFNQMDFGRFYRILSNSAVFFQKPTELGGDDFLVSTKILNTAEE